MRASGKSRASRAASLELRPGRLQIEAQPLPHELREARAPARVVHLPGARLVPDAAYEIELRQRLQRRAEVVAVQPGLRHRDRGKPGLAPQPLDIAHLADRVARVPFGLHVDGFHDLVAPRIGEVVGRKIGPPQRGVVAIAKRDRRLVAKPRVVIDARIPEMLVRIDDRKRVARAARGAILARPARYDRGRFQGRKSDGRGSR